MRLLRILMLVLCILVYPSVVSANAERDALNVFRSALSDPNKVLASWDAHDDYPCALLWITCNNDNEVTRIDLGYKDFSGQLVAQLGSLSNLQYLELYGNNISGKIPPELGSLTNLVSLDLYQNHLSGPIPEGVNYRPIGADVAIAGSIFACITFFIGVFVTVLVWLRRENKNQDRFFDLSAEDDPEIQLGALYWYSPKSLNRYTLTDLQVATDNFNPENIVGRGGFGQVYKGCLADGSLVAIKRLKDVRNKMEELQFQTEVEMISLVVHPNLLRLHGFCMTLTEKLLVYPFMANGSLASCLQGGQGSKPLLDWGKRKQVALGSAKGLAYLHHQFDPKVIHRDVKAANILLNDEFEAVVGDFGLVKLMGFEDSHLITGVCGTIGYIAPEYYSNGTCSEKTDVFGYGVMLLELLSGQKATDLAKIAIEDGGFMLHDWVKGLLKDKKLEKLVDGNLKGDYIQVEVEQLIQVALLSTHKFAMQRPTMYEVVRMLQGNGLAKRWQNQEALYQESDHDPHPNGPWIVDSTSRLRPDILSGPR